MQVDVKHFEEFPGLFRGHLIHVKIAPSKERLDIYSLSMGGKLCLS
jgi:hypothetical protein